MTNPRGPRAARHPSATGTLGRCLVLALLLSTGRTVKAEPGGVAGAPHEQAAKLHEDAERALADHDWDIACRLYEASQALDASATTQARIAQCMEHDGKLASALRAYQEALRLVETLDVARRRLAAEKFPEYIARLEPRVPSLRIGIAPELGVVEVRVEGVVLSPSELATARRVDPGPLVIAVQASGFLSQHCALRADEGARLDISIEPSGGGSIADGGVEDCETMPDGSIRILLQAEPRSAPRPSQSPKSSSRAPELPLDSGGPSASPSLLADAAVTDTSSQRTWGLALGSAGLASLGVAGYFGIRTLTLVSGADCDSDDVCSPRGSAEIEKARGAQAAGFIAGGAGALLLGAGLAVVLSASSASAPSRRVAGLDDVTVSINANGVWMSSSW